MRTTRRGFDDSSAEERIIPWWLRCKGGNYCAMGYKDLGWCRECCGCSPAAAGTLQNTHERLGTP